MTLYPKTCREIMSEWLRERLKPGDTATWGEIRQHMRAKYPKFKDGTIQAHIITLTTNAPSRKHFSPKPGRDDVLFRLDDGSLRLYESSSDPPPIYREESPDPEPDDGSDSEGYPELRYEADLRDYLARNLDQIEPGLTLYADTNRSGPEFPVEEGRIDLLAVDKIRDFVVIELKAIAGRPPALGQILYYMGWVEKNLAKGRRVRGIIIAREISEKLQLAARKVPDVALYTYELQVSVSRVDHSK